MYFRPSSKPRKIYGFFTNNLYQPKGSYTRAKTKPIDSRGHRNAFNWKFRWNTTRVTMLVLFLFCIFLFLDITDAQNCFGHKSILTSLSGAIQDGDGLYSNKVSCEWLIRAPFKNQTITIKAKSINLECQYDYLYIFDGGSYKAPLLASISGYDILPEIISTASEVLVVLQTDYAERKDGFELSYEVTDCPGKCSGTGICDKGKCVCTSGYSGADCKDKWCPSSCNEAAGKGKCDSGLEKCSCNHGFAGEGCSLPSQVNADLNTWHLLASRSSEFSPRSDHVMGYLNNSDSIAIFGGRSLNEVFNNVLLYNISSNSWLTFTSASGPVGRFLHAGDVYKNKLVIFGGEMTNGSLLNDLWVFDPVLKIWSQPAGHEINKPNKVAGHTANIVGDKLYVFGGRTGHGAFSSNIWEFDLKTPSGWQKMHVRGGKPSLYRFYGHSSVYCKETNSLLIYGGEVASSIGRNSMKQNRIVSFNLVHHVWTDIVPDERSSTSLPTAFHSAVVAGDYMVVYGGIVQTRSKMCFSNDIQFYNVRCNRWVPASTLGASSKTGSIQIGRISHTAVLRNDQTMVVVGGFNGVMFGDVHAYRLPKAVIFKNSSGFVVNGKQCQTHTEKATCYTDPACGWCFEPLTCLSLQDSSKCSERFDKSSCTSHCAAYTSCDSCLLFGNTSVEGCTWCVQKRKCYSASTKGSCSLSGWWGSDGQVVTDLEQCFIDNQPPGITYTRYSYPFNSEMPDSVTILDNTKINEPSQLKYNEKSFITGFVYPYLFEADPSASKPREVIVSGTYLSARLFVSKDQSPLRKEEVAFFPIRTSQTIVTAKSKTLSRLFPSPALTSHYYLQCGMNSTKFSSNRKMELFWNVTSINVHIPSKYLRPFFSKNCVGYTTCMACITDASCGWCAVQSSCIRKSNWSTCNDSFSNLTHLVTNQTLCPICSDLYDCTDCLKNRHCSWSGTDKSCLRKGLGSREVTTPSDCPSPCHSRLSCSSCLVDDTCRWCHQKQECFPPSYHMLRYTLGQCHVYSINLGSNQCYNCSTFTNCASCLAHHHCGWCSTTNNPLIGSCHQGDFSGPMNNRNCSVLLPVNETVSWAYGRCPDADECRLKLDDCHVNATCFNTDGSYNCQCNRGFTGNGKTTCNKTCYHECQHGYCGSDYQCKCDLGWKGVNCSTDCLCNGHSTCKTGIGICDKCYNYTTGSHCDECVNGSYGFPKNASGCLRCTCNDHGDFDKGTCDNRTGICFCQDQTTGDMCEKCRPGLSGDSRNGGICYHGCSSLTFIKNESFGTLSSGELGSNCLWVISATNASKRDVIFSNLPSRMDSTITLQMKHMDLSCIDAHLYVYDGIPGKLNASLIAVICGYEVQIAKPVVARSGVMTVRYEGVPAASAKFRFYASFNVHTCEGSCTGNLECVRSHHGNLRCLCKSGWTGADCQIQICPENCNNATSQGYCDYATGQCVCIPGFVGTNCSQLRNETSFLVEDMTCQDNVISSRFGHTMLVDEEYKSRVLIYGGRSLDFDFDPSIWTFDLVKKSCAKLQSTNQPIGRYYHCGVIYKGKMIIYGGNTTYNVSNEMLTYDIKGGVWKSEMETAALPGVYGHTCTLVGDVLYIIGGYLGSPLGIHESVLAVHLITWTWEEVKIKKFPMKGIFAHSAVYDATTNHILVFGGVAFSLTGSRESNRLWALDLMRNSWNEIQPTRNTKPVSLYGHSASIINDTMYILGGYSDVAKKGFNDDLLLWNIRCNQWLMVSLNDSLGLSTSQAVYFPSIAQSLAAINETLYYFGGFNVKSLNNMVKITPPSDICKVFKTESECLGFLGCSWCQSSATGICFKTDTTPPLSCNNTTTKSGAPCTEASLKNVNCAAFKTCSACVSKIPGTSESHCTWCVYHGCRNSTDSCPSKQPKHVVDCFDSTCEAASCETCKTESLCMWTQYFIYVSETHRNYTNPARGLSPWNCFRTSLEMYYGKLTFPAHDKSPPRSCPAKCSSYKSCGACLSSKGEEGGSKSCLWSQKLNLCFPPSTRYIACMSGDCGLIYSDTRSCPARCSLIDSCDSCLKKPSCGWCANPGILGQGVCNEGGLKGSRTGVCSYGNINATSIWAPVLCPLENECMNGRHNCTINEVCVDLEYGFHCKCKPGYKRDNRSQHCLPVCLQGCDKGSCVRPGVCECNFGWTSNNCTVACECNGHSNCPNETHTDICIKCHNNTQGPHCGECKAEYVGDPTKNIPCMACLTLCNGRTSICVSSSRKTSFPSSVLANFTLLRSMIKKGPTDPNDVVCLGCGGSSEGNLCETCIQGFFENDKTCTQCQCNGHGSTCDRKTGSGCICQQNTKSEEISWSKQCNQCKSLDFYGNPVGGRQCFQKMRNEQSLTIGNERLRVGSDSIIEGIPPNRTMFFAVPPRFTNVDIRLTVDVLEGGLDLYIATIDSVFVVDVNHTSGEHTLLSPTLHSRARRNVVAETVIGNGFPEMAMEEDGSSARFRRESPPVSNTTRPTVHPHVPKANQVYASADTPSMYTEYKGGIYLVKGIQRRVIIGIRYKYLDFSSDRFYVGIFTRGNKDNVKTAGLIYFRQELSQIDLFVFFTVFFSVFFLILSLFFLLWKIKQLHHGRQVVMQQQMAMETMASRPFSMYTVQCERNEPISTYTKIHSELMEAPASLKNHKGKRDRLPTMYPMAIEFTEDELAAVGTVFVQFPENEESLWNISLGSAILQATPQHLVASTNNEMQKTTRFMCTVTS